MKFMHITLDNRLAAPELATLRTTFWSNHTFPPKPVQGAQESEAAFAQRKQAYRAAKYQLQDQWIHNLELWPAAQIARVLHAVEYDPKDPDCLYVITLPEGYWHDIEPDDRTHTNSSGGEVYRYSNPLYEATAAILVNGRAGNPSVLGSIANKNLVIFAGTFWWKDTSGPVEVLYNSSPVYHDGFCRFIWEKQFVTAEDGLGQDSANPADKLHKWVDGRRAAFMMAGIPGAEAAVKMDQINDCAQAYLDNQRTGFLSPLARQFNQAGLPFLRLPLSHAAVSFSIDICADFIAALSRSILPAPPQIQIVPASGVSFRNPASYYAQSYHCFCDLQGESGTLPALPAAEQQAACAGDIPFHNLSLPAAGTLFNITDRLPLL